ncbi:MAG: succinate--CoA ligase subunit alpha [Betaproteobacteria bacterium]|nr:MAG: succinate--CoA ligase subunit alpha [Betaproteobacteria bacterium]
MSILIDSSTRVLVQGATGAQARFDIRYCLDYGTRIVAGVTPGRGGETVEGVPVFNTVAAALAATGANASAVYVPARGVKDAVMEAVEAGIRVLACFAENVPRHDAAAAVAAARSVGARMAGFNTNGVISPGRCKLGGIGGDRAAQIYAPGRIGVCSRSGGMSAEICWTLSRAGMGASTCVSMGGDPIVGMRMVEVLKLFEADPETDACVIFGEPGGTHEIEVAEALRAGELRKPVVALIAGQFQERYPAGVSFGHFAAVIKGENDSASAKRKILAAAGARVASSLEEIPQLLR